MKPKSLKRIGNLELRPASYLLPKDKWPEHGSWHIDYWYPNPYYGHEDDYTKDGDWYYYKDKSCRIHKDCFKHHQSCFAIASFDYDKDEEVYELHFIGDRPLDITKEEREAFWELLKLGYNHLNNKENV